MCGSPEEILNVSYSIYLPFFVHLWVFQNCKGSRCPKFLPFKFAHSYDNQANSKQSGKQPLSIFFFVRKNVLWKSKSPNSVEFSMLYIILAYRPVLQLMKINCSKICMRSKFAN